MRRKANIKRLPYVTTAVALSIFVASPAFAGPASKFAAAVSNVVLVPENTAENEGYQSVLTTYIKTPNKKDLLVGASFETGLYTKTQVKGKKGETDTAHASAGLYVQILIDDKPKLAYPYEIVYDKRFQELSATLGGVINSCTDTTGGPDGGPDGTITVADECDVTDESIEFILQTMAAHHYNFVIPNLTSGTHKVEVQVKVMAGSAAGNGSADAWGMVGRGSLTVEEVRATNAPEGIDGIIEFPD